MAEGNQRYYTYHHEQVFNPYGVGGNNNNPNDASSFSVSGTPRPYAHNPPRTPFPDPHQRAPHGGSIDLSPYHGAVPESEIAQMPVDNFIKSQDDEAWLPTRHGQMHHIRPSASGWYPRPPAKSGAMSDPTPGQNTCGEMSSNHSSSDAGDSRYYSNMRGTSVEVASLKQSSAIPAMSGINFPFSHTAAGSHVPGVTIAPSPHAPRSVMSEGPVHVPSKDSRKSRAGKAQLHPCPDCGRRPKNQSDAKKHGLTHTKPYRCTDPHCSRKDGFATDNDLQRHRKSVHGVTPTVGSSAGFICAACPSPEGGKGAKFWPRRDNFKAHVKRKHPNYNEVELITASKQDRRPDDVRTAPSVERSSYATSVTNSNEQQRSGLLSHEALRKHSHAGDGGGIWPPNSGGECSRTADSLLGGMGHATMSDPSMLSTAELQSLSEPTDTNSLSILSDVAFNQGLLRFMPSNPSPDPRGGKRLKMDESRFYRESEQHPHVANYGGGSHVRAGSSELQPAESTSGGQGNFPCTRCGKVVSRGCDFKKHLKRHTRPYGCTFPRCTKRFGSRNDWKRHESSQHYLSEMWKCLRVFANGAICANPPFPRVDSLKKHLHAKHGVTDPAEINAECAKFRLGRHASDHFWCGFCRKLIAQDRSMQNAYAARFQHIGDHFDKDDAHIDSWVCIDKDEPKGVIMAENGASGSQHEAAAAAAAVTWHGHEENEGVAFQQCTPIDHTSSSSSIIEMPRPTPAGFPDPLDVGYAEYASKEDPLYCLYDDGGRKASNGMQAEEDAEGFSDSA